jgi:taurine dioxygenase
MASTLVIRPLGAAGFAAEVLGLDAAARDPTSLHEQLRGAFAGHPVLALRTSGLDRAQLVSIVTAFGVPQPQVLRDHRLEGNPVISIISSEQFDQRGDGSRIVFGAAWHTDDSYMARPAAVTALYGAVLPDAGGDTLFADCTAAYEALSESTKARLAGVQVVHCYQARRNLNQVPARSDEEESETPPAIHPLVKVHPVTGRPALYLNPNRMDHVVGMPLDEGDALLDELIGHATSTRFVYRHRWQPNDVLVWDNRCTMHKASDDYGGARRIMHRVLLGEQAGASDA